MNLSKLEMRRKLSKVGQTSKQKVPMCFLISTLFKGSGHKNIQLIFIFAVDYF